MDALTKELAIVEIVTSTIEWHKSRITKLREIVDCSGTTLTIEMGGKKMTLEGIELNAFKIGVHTAIETLTPFPLRVSAATDEDDEDDFAHEGAPR